METRLKGTYGNPKLCVTLYRQNAHLLQVNSAFTSVASLDFGVSISPHKEEIREKIAQLKMRFPDEMVVNCSQLICNRLEQLDLFQNAKCIACYYATHSEVQTAELIEKWRTEKQIVLPAISGDQMHFHPYTGKENLKKGLFGLFEPVSNEIIPPETIDLFIVPGIAFDYACNRTGRGKGYYDRYLSDVNKPKIGLCFDFQLLKSIPCDMYDQKMTLVMTENLTVSSHHQ